MLELFFLDTIRQNNVKNQYGNLEFKRNFRLYLQKIYSLKLYFILPMKWSSNIQTKSYPYIFFFSSSYCASLISCIVMVPMDSTELQKYIEYLNLNKNYFTFLIVFFFF